MSTIFSLNNTNSKDTHEEELSPETTELLKKVLEYIANRRMLFSSEEIRKEILEPNGVKDLTTEKIIKSMFKKFDVFFPSEFNKQKMNAILIRSTRKEEKNLQLNSFKICNGIYSTEILKLQEYMDLLNSRTIARKRFLRLATDKYKYLSKLIEIGDILPKYEEEFLSLYEEIHIVLPESIENIKQIEQGIQLLLSFIPEKKQTITEEQFSKLLINKGNDKKIKSIISDIEKFGNLLKKIETLIPKYNKLGKKIEALYIEIAKILKKFEIKDLGKVELFIKAYEKMMERENNKNN